MANSIVKISYNAAIDACAKGGLWRRGLELLSEMELAGFRPSIVSYNTVLGVCGRAGRCGSYPLGRQYSREVHIAVCSASLTSDRCIPFARRERIRKGVH